ncbi:MAG: hypothetical protein NTV14_05945 [Coprothermobacterota bacterium]|nr:hypothetical protein [Coprothermobacterota bacterium]
MDTFERQISLRLRKETETLIPPTRLLEEIQRRILIVFQEEDPSISSWTASSATSVPDMVCQFQAVRWQVI